MNGFDSKLGKKEVVLKENKKANVKKIEPVMRIVSSSIRFSSGKAWSSSTPSSWWLSLKLSCGHEKVIEDVKPIPETTECYLCKFNNGRRQVKHEIF